MSDPEAPGMRDLAADLAALARDLGFVPMLFDQVKSLDKQSRGTNLIAQDIGEMALAACEAELRSLKVMNSLISVVRMVIPTSSDPGLAMRILDDALQELDAARERIDKAMEQVMARSAAREAGV